MIGWMQIFLEGDRRMFRFILLIGALGFAAGSPALAQDQKNHVAYYQSYNSALEHGDRLEAEKFAEAAWRAAETELGDHPTTAI